MIKNSSIALDFSRLIQKIILENYNIFDEFNKDPTFGKINYWNYKIHDTKI